MIGLIAIARTIARGCGSLVRDPQARGLMFVVLGLVWGGAFFYRQVEDLSWIDSFYFTIVTLTTVGYGDFTPETTAGKLFTMAYLLIGIGIVVALAGEVASHLIRANTERRAERTGEA
ncbi:MAG: potassium channel family protein [Ilumatobacter sp.]|uniref:potassium channel family protein n=1 Tax=Ilumatobacter sp. TaxID=1967498 RepID=UPI00261E82E5|nr:potassium channel family protein [Ilumatobacter sp.]MDJ0768981.1 potassium channel family protein [Ilumatobacter sp.]